MSHPIELLLIQGLTSIEVSLKSREIKQEQSEELLTQMSQELGFYD